MQYHGRVPGLFARAGQRRHQVVAAHLHQHHRHRQRAQESAVAAGRHHHVAAPLGDGLGQGRERRVESLVQQLPRARPANSGATWRRRSNRP